MGRLFKHTPFIFTVLFLVAGIFSSLLIRISIRERHFTELELVNGTVLRIERTGGDYATHILFLEESDREYRIIPAAIRKIGRQRMLSELTIGTVIELQVEPFRGGLATKGITSSSTIILCIDEMAESAYKDARVGLVLGIVLVSVLFPLSALFFIIGICKIFKEQKLDSSERNEYGIRKIHHEFLGNIIDVFHDVNSFMLSIFVNGELRSQVGSFVAATQKTQIIVQSKSDGEESFVDEILTLTNNGFGTLCLYHKGNRLVKKRQPFG